MTSFLQGLEGSGWLKHISNILESSMFIVNVSYFLRISQVCHSWLPEEQSFVCVEFLCVVG